MKSRKQANRSTLPLLRRQKGFLTVFTGIVILVMLTLMMVFAVRVSVSEQRISANDVRQKLALHAAEAGIQHAKEFFIANSALVASDRIDKLPDGTDGWLAPGAERWLPCSSVDLTAENGSHPCYAQPNLDRRANSYFYSYIGSTEINLNTNDILPGTSESVSVQALLCKLVISPFTTPPVQGCSKDPDLADEYHYMVTILARGRADCSGDSCYAEALVAEPMANYGVLSGGNGAGVPLTTRTSWPPSGNAEIVPNPNGGGIGVPVSVWLNSNENCGGAAVVDPSSGAWATCEMHEWYETGQVPEDLECPHGSCGCSFSESISYTHGSSDVLGIDMDFDPEFPCDLFTFYFGIPKTHYEAIKSQATIIDDCSELGPNSFGTYWATGPLCHIGANTVIGSQHAPVMLISAASVTRFNGGTKMFGTFYLTDVEDPDAEIQTNGNNTIYGAAIIDGTIGAYTGTFQLIYVETVARIVAGTGGIGTLAGGWTDFHRDWK